MARKARGRRGNRGRRLAAEDGLDGGLPASLVGSSLDGPFIVPDLKLWEDAPSCRGVRPPIEARPSPVVVGTNYTTEEITLATQGKLPLRAVIWSARSGLGNSVQGFITTFIFAILSGRQLLVSYGGLYGASFETIASGFEFAIDHTERSVPRVPGIKFEGNPDITDSFPVVQGNPHDYFDDFWYAKEDRRRCVMDSLKCQDLWCVRSKIVRMMLGHPSLALGRAIEGVVHYAPSARGGHDSSSRRRLLSGASRLFPLPAVKAEQEQQALNALPAQAGEGGAALGDQLREPGEGGRRLLSEGEGDEPGARGLRLQFDVTVHVRSAHKCMEGTIDFPQCRERGLEGAVDTLSYFPELRKQVLVKRWACISYVLSFLLQLKIRRQTELGEKFKGLFQDPRDREEMETFLVNAEHHVPPRNKEAPPPSPDVSRLGSFNGSQLLKDWGLWTIDAAADVARGEGETAGKDGELSILLATDTEALRPLYVEYLRPFGSVTYSAAKVVHLAHRTGDDLTRLGNLAEFYLISRASMLLSCPIRRSSYARAAALYGNSTLVYGVHRSGCGLEYEHVAEQMR